MSFRARPVTRSRVTTFINPAAPSTCDFLAGNVLQIPHHAFSRVDSEINDTPCIWRSAAAGSMPPCAHRRESARLQTQECAYPFIEVQKMNTQAREYLQVLTLPCSIAKPILKIETGELFARTATSARTVVARTSCVPVASCSCYQLIRTPFESALANACE